VGLFFIHCGKSCLEELSLLLADQLGRRKPINCKLDGALAQLTFVNQPKSWQLDGKGWQK
jgi:hypothetical protein